jgi:hypothetical protein
MATKAWKVMQKLLERKKEQKKAKSEENRGVKTNIGGPTGSYFGTKTYKQKLNKAGDWRKKKNIGKAEDK